MWKCLTRYNVKWLHFFDFFVIRVSLKMHDFLRFRVIAKQIINPIVLTVNLSPNKQMNNLVEKLNHFCIIVCKHFVNNYVLTNVNIE